MPKLRDSDTRITPGSARGPLLDQRGRPVERAVVHVDDLLVALDLAEGGAEALVQLREVLLLVETGTTTETVGGTALFHPIYGRAAEAHAGDR